MVSLRIPSIIKNLDFSNNYFIFRKKKSIVIIIKKTKSTLKMKM